MKSLFSNFNARLLLIHFIAFWFFMYGFQMISFLHDYDFLFFQHTLRINFHGRFDYDMVIIEQSGSFFKKSREPDRGFRGTIQDWAL